MMLNVLRRGAAASISKATRYAGIRLMKTAPPHAAPPHARPPHAAPPHARPPHAAPPPPAQGPPDPLLPWWPKYRRGRPPIWRHGEVDRISAGIKTPLLVYVRRNRPFQSVTLFGEGACVDLQTDRFRRVKDSFTLLLLRNQDENQICYYPLTPDMFVVNEHGNVEIAEGVVMSLATPASTAVEFSRGAHILHFIQYSECKSKINTSEDNHHFIDMLRSPLLVKGYMLSIHGTLMPLESRSLATIQVHDFVRHDIPFGQKDEILAKLDTDRQWYVPFAQSFLLNRWLVLLHVEPHKAGKSVSAAEYELVCLRNLECHKLINKRKVCAELCDEHFRIHGRQPTDGEKIQYSYTNSNMSYLVYYKRGMTLHRCYDAIAEIDMHGFKVLKPHIHFCIACKSCNLSSGCLRARLLKQKLTHQERPVRAVTVLKVLKLLSAGCNKEYTAKSLSLHGEVVSGQQDMVIDIHEQEVLLNFPCRRYGRAHVHYYPAFPETVHLIQGEEVEIFFDADGWMVVRKLSGNFCNNDSIGLVPASCVEVHPDRFVIQNGHPRMVQTG